MKIFKLGFALIIFPFFVSAQTSEDALRYSHIFHGGTARNLGLGGAMGALGGDFSSAGQNPGGIGIYRSSEVTVSPQLANINAGSTLFGQQQDDDVMNFNFSNIGIVIHREPTSSTVKALNIGFGMNRYANFHRRIHFSGNNPSNSILHHYTHEINTAPPNERTNPAYVSAEAVAAYNAYLINPTDTFLTAFESVVPYGGVHQEGWINTSGKYEEFQISLGTNFNDNIYLGATIGLPNTRYREVKSYRERDEADTIPGFASMELQQELTSDGMGINLKIGSIFWLGKMVRLGAAIHSPSNIAFSEVYSSTITSAIPDTANVPVTHSFDIPEGTFDYRIVTPWRAIASAALVSQYGLISVDYEYVDYSSTRFRFPTTFSEAESSRNNNLRELYRAASNIRAGAEVKAGKFLIRGGYAYYGSPFRESFDGAQVVHNISGGAGIRLETFFVDFSYTRSFYDELYIPYSAGITADIPQVNIDVTQSLFTATVGFRF